jgi:hypothetical protein
MLRDELRALRLTLADVIRATGIKRRELEVMDEPVPAVKEFLDSVRGDKGNPPAGLELRAKRKSLGLSAIVVARYSCLYPNQVESVERGCGKAEWAHAIADFLKVAETRGPNPKLYYSSVYVDYPVLTDRIRVLAEAKGYQDIIDMIKGARRES